MWKRGDLVWGKWKSSSWWPAIVIAPEDCGRDRNTQENKKMWLFWFGDHKVSQIECAKIEDFEQRFSEMTAKKIGKSLNIAIEESLIISAKRYEYTYKDPSSLLDWARNNFTSCLVSQGQKRKFSELPDIVCKALDNKNFKRRYVSDSDTESDDECDVCVQDVRKGIKSLEDICIICCKPQFKIIMQHPTLMGGVCLNCKKALAKTTKLKTGLIQDICIICAQGGNLIFCSSELCLRSYCELCIDYLAPRGYYTKILKTEFWKCFMCISDNKVLIKRREYIRAQPIVPPPLPNVKPPIRVIAHATTALSVLKKMNIAVDLFCTEPSESCLDNSAGEYVDFSQDEFVKIHADLVCGSFFVESRDLENLKKCLLLFSPPFFRFLFRLDNAKLYNPDLFFIFISQAEILSADVISHVLRFLSVDPIPIAIAGKDFLVWTNIPHVNLGKQKFAGCEVKGNEPFEEKILIKFMHPLKNYFKSN